MHPTDAKGDCQEDGGHLPSNELSAVTIEVRKHPPDYSRPAGIMRRVANRPYSRRERSLLGLFFNVLLPLGLAVVGIGLLWRGENIGLAVALPVILYAGARLVTGRVP